MGRLLAAALKRPFVDTDEEIVRLEGLSIDQIVARGGWPLFRRCEKQVISQVCSNDGQIVATGGGVVLDEQNVTAMKRSGRVIWLRAGAAVIYQRMIGDQQTRAFRPALTDHDPFEEIKALLEKREPHYSGAADAAIDTDTLTAAETSTAVLQWIEKYST